MGTTAAVKKESKMMDTFDHAVGPEKFELMGKQQGNDDPFFLRVINRADFKGTKDDPIIVNALDQYRMVGCSCKEGDTTIHWFWLKEHAPVDLYDMPARRVRSLNDII